MTDKAYLYGVLLGDGFYGNQHKSKHPEKYDYVMLKVIDIEFAEKFQATVERLTGKKYSIYKMPSGRKTWQDLYLCKCYAPWLVEESLFVTKNRTEIPNFVQDGDVQTKVAFIQGIMDSEGYLTMSISPLKSWHVGIYVACSSAWMKDLWHMFSDLGIKTGKLLRTVMKDGRKTMYSFKIDIFDYQEKGLSFAMKRKRDRLEFVSRILRDYTCSYKEAYKNAQVEDRVHVNAKALI